MSTFDGIVNEFPNIRIDHFRHHPDSLPPQACFLSHVHSDHLQGLETLKMPFVYCSAATKKILLRLEKYPHRINFAKGILEARKQTYKSLKFVLRTLPYESPVDIELGPKSRIRVTLFDANHCPGAVMFLIEGDDKAILYTGDIRAEPWWVNSIVRNPVLLPYTCGVRRLDCIYLDTTFASRDNLYEHFPTKAEGLQELLTKVSKCPSASNFYFRSWTLGYEDVWIALSSFLRSRIHVDDYQLRIFRSLADETGTDRGPALAGFDFGNQHQLGCLTDDITALIHSCEPGTECYDQIKKHKNIVWITPIVSRTKDGTEIAEIGAGGGGGDLYQVPQLELIDQMALDTLGQLFANSDEHKEALSRLGQALLAAKAKGVSSIDLDGLELDDVEAVSLKEFVQLISSKNGSSKEDQQHNSYRTIRFPYSRHSSFSELRHLVSSFKPNDVCPCTVDIDTWSEDVSMKALFGDICSEDIFKFDSETRSIVAERQEQRGQKRKRGNKAGDSQRTYTQESMNTEEAYRSAKTSMQSKKTDESQNQPQPNEDRAEKMEVMPPTPIRELYRTLSGRFVGISKGAGQQYAEVQNTTDTSNNSVEQPVTSSTMTSQDRDNQAALIANSEAEFDADSASDVSLPDSTFAFSEPNRTRSCKRAFRAARVLLDSNDPSQWQDLRVRSLGWMGHTEAEMEL